MSWPNGEGLASELTREGAKGFWFSGPPGRIAVVGGELRIETPW